MRLFWFSATLLLSCLAFSSSVEEVRYTVRTFGDTFNSKGALLGAKCPNLAKNQEQRALIEAIMLYGDVHAQDFTSCSSDDLAAILKLARCMHDETVAYVATGQCMDDSLTARTNVCNAPFVLSKLCEHTIRVSINIALSKVKDN